MKKIIAILMMNTICVVSFSQRTIRWEREWSTVPADVSVGTVTDANNNVYVTGITGNGTDTDITTLKYDQCGVLQWTKTYDSGFDDDVIGIGIDNSGNIYLAGNYGSTTKKPLIIKYNSAGTVIWSQQLAVTQGSDVRTMVVDGSGNVYFAGSIPVFGEGNNTFVNKITPSGTWSWSSNYDGGNSIDDEINDIHLDGNYIYTTGMGNGSDIMTLKHSTGGSFIWATTAPPTGWSGYGIVVKTDGAGNVYVAGRGSGYYRTIKYNSAGTEMWNDLASNAVGGTNATPYDMVVDASGNSYITGQIDNGSPAGNIDMLTIKYNSTGTRQWARHFVNGDGDNLSATDDDKGRYLIFDTNGDIIVFGAVLMGANDNRKSGYVTYSPNGIQGSVFYVPNSHGSVYAVAAGNGNDIFMVYNLFSDKKVTRLNEVPTGFQANSSPSVDFCLGDSIQLNGTVPSGSTFSWSPTTGLSDSSSLSPWAHPSSYTTYTLTLNDCDGESTVNVISHSAPPSTLVVNNTLSYSNDTINKCVGDSVAVRGINSSYDYYWYNVNDGGYAEITTGTSTLYLTQQGVYFAQVFLQTYGCMDTTIYVTVNLTSPTVIANSASTVICAGDPVTLTGSGASFYSWSNGVSNGIAFTPTTTTTYTVTGTSGLCSNTDQITITVNSAPTVTAGASTTIICSGDPVTLTGSGATTYSWDNGVTNGTPFTPTSTTTYTVTGTGGNGCTNTDVVSVAVNSVPTVNLGTDFSVCQGMTTTIDAGSGFSSYSWNTGASTQTLNAGLGTYDVTVTNGNGCQGTDQIMISEYNAVTGTASSTDATCGNNNGSASVAVTSGVLPYSYSWSNGATTQSITSLSAGSYTVTITDMNGCQGQATASVSSTGGASLTTSLTDVLCNGNSTGTALVSTSGGTSPFSYLWSTGGTTSSVSNLAAGTYSVDVTDNNGCISSTSVTITEPSPFNVIPSSTDASCNGLSDGIANVSVTGGASPYSYNWTNGGAGATETNLTAGSYTVTITDVNACTTNQTIVINEPTVIVITTSAIDATCGNSDGSATSGATGGAGNYTYLWNDGATQISQTATNLVSGSYIVTVTDMDGCLNTASANVNDAGAPTLTATNTDVNCAGGNDGSATVSATGGVSPFIYSWNDGQTTQTASGLLEGSYTVTVTDNNGCSSSVTITVAATNQLPVVDLGSDSLMCNNSNITLDAGTGFVNYLWNDNSISQTLVVSTSGTYSVEVTDNNSCSNMDTIAITTEICNSIEELTNNTIRVFPNPSSSAITIAGDDIKGKLITLYSLEGKIVYQKTLLNTSFSMDVSKYEAGTYFVYIEGIQPVKILIIK